MTAGESVKLRCVNQDGTAVGFCSKCKEPVCDQCVDGGEGDAIVCRNCGYKEALGGVDEDAAKKKAAAVRLAEEKGKGPGRVRRAAGVTILVGVLAVVSVWAVPTAVASLTDGRPYAVGPIGDDDAPGLDDCVFGLWRVRVAMDDYLYLHKGQAPSMIEDLAGAPRECPGCDAPWAFRADGKTYEVACPQPRKHKRAAVFLDHRIGPPQVRLDGGK